MEEDVSEWWNYWTSCVVVVAVITVSVCLLGPIRRIARGSGGSGTEGEGKCPLTGEDNGACPVTREVIVMTYMLQARTSCRTTLLFFKEQF